MADSIPSPDELIPLVFERAMVNEPKLDGVGPVVRDPLELHLGTLFGVKSDGSVLVRVGKSPEASAVVLATAIARFSPDEIGRTVTLLDRGPERGPLVLGMVSEDETSLSRIANLESHKPSPVGDLELSADNSITLRCGKSSITLSKDGRVLIRGEYILSRAAGTNRIRGGSVLIN